MVLMQLVEFLIHLVHLNLVHLILSLPPVPSCLNLNQSCYPILIVPSTSTSSFLFESQSELLSYLDSDPVSEYDDDFNILSWWRDHRRAYPVLFILAKKMS
jgi:hypothetical protein